MEIPSRAVTLRPNPLKTLAMIAAQCDGAWCHLNQVQLADLTGFSRKSVRLYLQKLYIEGYLDRLVPPAGENHNHARYWYRVRGGNT